MNALNSLPAAITRRAVSLDLDEVLVQRSKRHEGPEHLDKLIARRRDSYEPELRPAAEQLRSAVEVGEVATFGEAKRWLLDWGLTHLEPSADKLGKVRRILDYWHQQKTFRLRFLPTGDCWRATSYLNFSGSSGEFATALLKRWFERWEAVPVTHHGTMMNFEVGNPPHTAADAADVAWEHYQLAQGTTNLRGVDLSLYAQALIGHARWSLHEKP